MRPRFAFVQKSLGGAFRGKAAGPEPGMSMWLALSRQSRDTGCDAIASPRNDGG
jgi:hypothetical protein